MTFPGDEEEVIKMIEGSLSSIGTFWGDTLYSCMSSQ